MVAEKDIIVAFELGSSAIRGIAGRKEADGSFHILAIDQEQISGSIRRGTIYNINKTTSAITRIKERLNERLSVNIKRAYVGVAGQSVHTVFNKVSKSYDTKVKVTQEIIDSLMDTNRAVQYPDREILEVAPQEYHLGIDTASDPIGIQVDKIDGRYLNIIARSILQENIRRCMRDADLEVVELFITPLEVAKALLPDTDKRSGCALVDIGAETTTVAIFTKNILRHLATIPLGGKNVTNDIATLKKVEVEEAEAIKLKYGKAIAPVEKEENPKMIRISNDRNVSEEEIQRITSARYDEIISNVWNQIDKGKWQNDLLSGITITGGASYMSDMAEALAKMNNIDANKIKTAKELLSTMPCDPRVNKTTKGFNAAIALLMQGSENCIGEDIVADEPYTEPKEEVVSGTVTEEIVVVTSEDPKNEEEQKEETKGEGKKEKKSKGPGFISKIGNILGKLVNEEDE